MLVPNEYAGLPDRRVFFVGHYVYFDDIVIDPMTQHENFGKAIDRGVLLVLLQAIRSIAK